MGILGSLFVYSKRGAPQARSANPGVIASEDSAFGISRLSCLRSRVKSILLCLVVTILCSSFIGCTSGMKKSSIRMYEGDSSPNIRMYEEKPGYPLNKF